MFIAFTVLNASSRALVMPHIRAWEMRTEARKLLHENRAFSLVVSEHPEVGQQFEAMMVEVARSGGSADLARARGLEWGRNVLGPYFSQYAPRASDESLTSYVSTLVRVL